MVAIIEDERAASVLLVGRESASNRDGRDSGGDRAVYETHAKRLEARNPGLTVDVATYEQEPSRELEPVFDGLDSSTVYVVPMCFAHTRDTTHALPTTFTAFDGTVRYCDPVGTHGAVSEAIRDRATSELAPGSDVSLVLAALGNSSAPHHREAAENHADRLRDIAGYAAVRACYLVQNPTVECVRYAVPTDRAVTVPLFLTPGPATRSEIPSKLELDRGGMAYADPLGTHERLTVAIESVVQTRRAVAGEEPTTFEDSLLVGGRPKATDGTGR